MTHRHWMALTAVAMLSIALTVCAHPVMAQTGADANQRIGPDLRLPDEEAEITARLDAVAPDAVVYFELANVSYQRGDLETTRDLYLQVLAYAPEFPDAARRLSWVMLNLSDVDSALAYAQIAYQQDPGPLNRATLAAAYLVDDNYLSQMQAMSMTAEAVRQRPDDPYILEIRLLAGLRGGGMDVTREAAERLTEVSPDNPMGHYFAGIAAAEEGDIERAEASILRSQELGMPSDRVEEALNEYVRPKQRVQRLLRAGGIVLGAWMLAPLFLFGAGVLLSALTLKAVRETPPTLDADISRGERSLRRIYRGVIVLVSLYYYASLPFLILFTLALTGGLLYLFFVMRILPYQIIAIIVAVGGYTIYVIVRSTFVRIKQAEPGHSLPREEAPALWALADAVAARLDQPLVDAIYVTPGTGIAATERPAQGAGLRRWQQWLKGERNRFLILGLGALEGMNQGQLKAILAHEYGHFSNRDTAGGEIANRVQASASVLARNLAGSAQESAINPVQLFINGFLHLFARITRGASRLQEILADRYAVRAYGFARFESGLKHIWQQSPAFDARAKAEIETALTEHREMRNLYGPPQDDLTITSQVTDSSEAERMAKATGTYDTHPSPKDRLALLTPFADHSVPDEPEDSDPVWNLFNDPERLQLEMTRLVETNVRQQLQIAAAVQMAQQEAIRRQQNKRAKAEEDRQWKKTRWW